MTREEAIVVFKAFMDNSLFSDVHKAAFSIAIHDIKQRHDWDINKLMLVPKTEGEQEPFINKPCVSIGVCHEDKIKVLDKIRADIIDEKDFAYADFEQYKEEVLEAEPDELPDDDFRFGMERAIEIIDKYKAESEDKE